MALFSLSGTSPTPIINTSVPRTYELHAEKANTDTIKLSSDPGFVEFEEMTAGSTLALENFTGTIWALVASGTLKLHVVWNNYQGTARKV